jgi:hypothetical protein
LRKSRMRLLGAQTHCMQLFIFIHSSGQRVLFNTPSDAPEQKKYSAACGFESRMRLLRKLSNTGDGDGNRKGRGSETCCSTLVQVYDRV